MGCPFRQRLPVDVPVTNGLLTGGDTFFEIYGLAVCAPGLRILGFFVERQHADIGEFLRGPFINIRHNIRHVYRGPAHLNGNADGAAIL
jgi:hypothetical protein